MGYTRRKYLAIFASAVGATSLVGTGRAQNSESPSCYEDYQYRLPTPTAPDEPSNDAVITEAYGELVLSSDRPYWILPICTTPDLMSVEYEVRPADNAKAPSILLVDERGLSKYRTKVQSHPLWDGPILSHTTLDLGRFGTHEVPTGVNSDNIHPWNLTKIADDVQPWEEDSSTVNVFTTKCLNSAASGPIQKRRTIAPKSGRYYVVFDWTDDVLQEPDTERVSAEVSLRVTKPIDEQEIEEKATASMEQLYGGLTGQQSPLVETVVDLANAICLQVPDAFETVSVSEINEVAPQAGQLVSSVNIVLTILENRLGFDSSVLRRLTSETSAWTRWGMSVLPVASSLDQLLEDACTVADARPADVTEEVEKMLMSLGILIADLVAAYYGVAGRAAKFVVGMAHKYLLGFVARALGLKTYLLLLRELYTLTLSGIREVLSAIKEVTREIAQEYDWLDEEDVERVDRLDKESLRSLDLDIDLFSFNPECST